MSSSDEPPGDDESPGQDANPDLPPIPPEGTSAPTDPERTFGRTPRQPTTRTTAPPDRGVLSEEQRRSNVRLGRAALVLGVAALAFSVPLFPLGLALGLAAIVVGALASRRGRRSGMTARGAVPGVVLGVVATVLASVVTAVVVAFFDELTEWQECRLAANTIRGEEICQQTLERQLRERLDTP